MSRHYSVSFGEIIANFESEDVTRLSSNQKFTARLTARQWYDHFRKTVGFTDWNSFLFFKFFIPNYDFSSFVTTDEGLWIFPFTNSRDRTTMPRNCFGAWSFLPKIDRAIAHSWKYELMRLVFICSFESY